MSGLTKNNDGNYESSIDNLSEINWVTKQIKKELSELQKDIHDKQIKESFFEKTKDGDKEKVIYKMDLVKNYLQSCIQKEDFQINSAVVMAVQIVLEANKYDVGKIDGLLKNNKGTQSKTEKVIADFQGKNGLKKDGIPGRETIKNILEKLGKFDVPQVKLDNNESMKQEDQIKLFALEIYRRGIRITDNEIDAQGYDPKEVRKWVKNTSEMERLDKIIPKRNRYGQPTEVLNENNPDDESLIPENTTSGESTEEKENDNQNESRESTEILVGPKLKATDKSELGGVGSKTMYGISKAGNFEHLQGDEKASTEKRLWFKEEFGQYKMLSYGERPDIGEFCRERGIKSFMLCFEGNENWEKFKDNIMKLGDYISSKGIQPVLCTCVGDNALENKNISGNANINDLIRVIGRSKNRPVIDFAKIDHDGILRDGEEVTPEGYSRMATKIDQCFSSAEK